MERLKERILTTPRLLPYAENDFSFFGFTTLNDVAVLFHLIEHLKPEMFLEIGTNRGATTCFLADAFPNMMFWTVDFPNNEMPELHENLLDVQRGESLWRSEIGIAFRDRGLSIRQIYGDSRDYRSYRPMTRFDLCFVDGSHRYKDVLSDTLLCLSKGTERLCVVWHDANMETVSDALRFLSRSIPIHLIDGTRCAVYSRWDSAHRIFGERARRLEA